MNDCQFKLVKLLGEFVWHDHKHTDEVFAPLKGEMEITFRDGAVTVSENEIFVVPRGKEHITRAANECHAPLIELRGVVNSGEAAGVLTAKATRGSSGWPRRTVYTLERVTVGGDERTRVSNKLLAEKVERRAQRCRRHPA